MAQRATHILPADALQPFRQFRAEERGTMTIFTLIIFIIMIMVGGIAVDLMKFESERVTLQNTLDRAVLAAADRDQKLSPKEVVLDYFAKAGLSDYIDANDITVDQDDLVSYRTVSAKATHDVSTHFMKMTGVDTLSAPASGTAEERIGDLEISMVLDVSGSMGGSKLTDLKTAAKKFVDQIISQSEADSVSFSIIPYATQVNASAELLDYFSVTDEHNYSNCVLFDAADFTETAIDPDDLIQRAGHFDPWRDWTSKDSSYDNESVRRVCHTETSREIIAWEKDATILKDHIDSFFAQGNTSIEIGVKWGIALLDPAAQSVVTDMIEDELVSEHFQNRPFEYDYSSGQKIIVVMTDGINTTQYYLRDEFLSGYSDIYENDHDGLLSVYYESSTQYENGVKAKYWWEYDDDWHVLPYGEGAEIATVTYNAVRTCWGTWWGGTRCKITYQPETTYSAVVGEAVRQTYPELFKDYSLEYIADEILYKATGSSTLANTIDPGARSSVGGSTKDTRLQNICKTAKDTNEVVIYTIGYEVTEHSEQEMKDCATTYNHYYDVNSAEVGKTIEDAFASIATAINNLKLTQ